MAAPIKVQITGDSKGLSAAVRQANASLDSLNQSARQSQQSLDKIDGMFGALGKGAAAVGGLYAIGEGLRQVTTAASDLQQAQGAIDAVFKSQAGAMQEAAAAANDLGLSQAEYGNLAVRLGSQLKNLGLESAQVSAQTENLISIGADFAAMFGGTASQAVEALSATLRGEYDPAERYGITLTAAAVNAEMASKGISKAQATINLIMAQGGDALGQWNREADTFAVKQQKMNAAVTDAKAKVGEGLLPVMTLAADVAGKFGSALAAIPTPMYTIAAAAAALVIGKKLLAAATARATAALTAYEVKVQTAARGTSLLGVAAGSAATKMQAIGRGLGIAAVALIGWEQASGKANDSLRQQVQTSDQIAQSLGKQGASIRDLNIDLSNWAGATPLIDDQLESWKALEHVFNQSGWEKGKNVLGEIFSLGKGEGTVERTAAVEWLTNVKDAIRQLAAEDPRRAGQLFTELQDAMREAGASSEDLAAVQAELGPVLEEAGVEADGQTSAMQELTQAHKDTVDAVKELDAVMKALSDPFLQAQQAEADWAAALEETRAAVAAGATGLDAYTEAGRNNRKTLDELTSAAMSNLSALAQNGASAGELTAAQQLMGATIRQAALDMGASEAQADAYAASILGIPPEAFTKVTADVGQAQANINGLIAQLTALTTRTWRTVIDVFRQDSGSTSSSSAPSPRAAPAPQLLPGPRSGAVTSQSGGAAPVTNGDTIGRIQPRRDVNVAVLIDGERIPARTVTTDPWTPNLVGAR